MSPKKLLIGAGVIAVIGFGAQSFAGDGTDCKGVNIGTPGEAAANVTGCLTNDAVDTAKDAPSLVEQILSFFK